MKMICLLRTITPETAEYRRVYTYVPLIIKMPHQKLLIRLNDYISTREEFRKKERKTVTRVSKIDSNRQLWRFHSDGKCEL